tara:strand:+ start:1039 stop:1476 length:438 start_codon:yes stop_codon:yes gene_type:complete
MTKKVKKGGNVIKGPWLNKKEVKIKDIDGLEVIENLKFADDLTEGLMIQILTNLRENNIDVSNKRFSPDIAFMIETLKAVIYRSMGYEHPLHIIMSSVLKVNEIKDGDKIHIDSSFDMDLLSDTSDYISLVKEEDNDNDDGPEKK